MTPFREIEMRAGALFDLDPQELELQRYYLAAALMHHVLHPERAALIGGRPSARWAVAALGVYSCGARPVFVQDGVGLRGLAEMLPVSPHLALAERAEQARALIATSVVSRAMVYGDVEDSGDMAWMAWLELGRVRLSHYDKDIAERSQRLAAMDGMGHVVRLSGDGGAGVMVDEIGRGDPAELLGRVMGMLDSGGEARQ